MDIEDTFYYNGLTITHKINDIEGSAESYIFIDMVLNAGKKKKFIFIGLEELFASQYTVLFKEITYDKNDLLENTKDFRYKIKGSDYFSVRNALDGNLDNLMKALHNGVTSTLPYLSGDVLESGIKYYHPENLFNGGVPPEFTFSKLDETSQGADDGQITVNVVSGSGDYEYELRAMDNTTIVKPFQASNVISNIEPGSYKIYVKSNTDGGRSAFIFVKINAYTNV